MLVGARLNWLLGHGEAPQWNPDAKFIQVDIEPTEMDSNQPIAAPLVGDIGSVMDGTPRAGQARPDHGARPRGVDELARTLGAERRQDGAAARMRDPHPMQFYGRSAGHPRRPARASRQAYVVNEGANALDFARNVIDMQVPRHRLDSGTWGVMGIGMGYAIAAAVESGAPGRRDRRRQRIRVQRHGARDDLPLPAADRRRRPQQRRRLPRRRCQRRLGGPGADNADAAGPPRPPDRGVRRQGLPGRPRPPRSPIALTDALASGRPALIDCVIDPTDGTESGHITHLNPNGVGKQ